MGRGNGLGGRQPLNRLYQTASLNCHGSLDRLGDVAQLAEHCLCKAGVEGSSPFVSTTRNPCSSLPPFR